jgi:hypothetical protein
VANDILQHEMMDGFGAQVLPTLPLCMMHTPPQSPPKRLRPSGLGQPDSVPYTSI